MRLAVLGIQFHRAAGRLQEAEHQPGEGTLPHSGGPCQDSEATRPEVMRKAFDDRGAFFLGIRERDIIHPDARSILEHEISLESLYLEIFQFQKPLDGSQSLDKGRDLPPEIGDRPLDLADKLQERRHHTISDCPVLDPDYSPQEGRRVPAHEAKAHETAGHSVVVKSLEGVLDQKVLNASQTRHDITDTEESQHQHTVLEVFLDNLLNITVLRTDQGRQLTDLSEIHLGSHHSRQHQDYKNPKK